MNNIKAESLRLLAFTLFSDALYTIYITHTIFSYTTNLRYRASKTKQKKQLLQNLKIE